MDNSLMQGYINRSNALLKRYKKGMYLKNKHTNDVFKITCRRPSFAGVYVRMCRGPGQIEVKGFYHVSDLVSHFEIMTNIEAVLYGQ